MNVISEDTQFSKPIESSTVNTFKVTNGRKWTVKQIFVFTFEKIKIAIKNIFERLALFFLEAKKIFKKIIIISKINCPDTSVVLNHVMSFSSQENQEILRIANEFRKYTKIDSNLKIPSVKRIDPSLHNWIFEIDNFDGIIFKMNLKQDGLKERLEAIKYGQDICQKYNLNLLKIPETNVLVKDNLYADRKYRFLKNPEEISKIYSKETLSKIYMQLLIFICKTGTTDLTSQNYGFLTDGSGVCLYDLEDINPNDPSYGLRSFITSSGHFGSECSKQTGEIIKANAPNTYKQLFGQ